MLTETEFSEKFAKRLIESISGLKIYSINGLEIQMEIEDSNEYFHFLNNCYLEYLREPEDLENIFQKYLNAAKSLYESDEIINLKTVLPVIKDERFIKSLIEINPDSEIYNVYEKYNDQLYIFYVQDTETNIYYLTQEDFRKLNINKEELRRIAIENLSNLFEIEKHGGDGYYMLIADGNYESSLILLDIWNEENFEVKGKFVIGIPSRDVLIVTGKNDVENVERLLKIIKEINESGDHLVSENLFEYNSGRFE